jgi:phage shock protein PspC (stress-responsive transcriptional regulator)
VLIFLSFPTVFLLGGGVLTLWPSAWRSRPNRWLYGAFAGVLGAAFLVLYVTAVRAQKTDLIEDCWASKFPQWDEPWLVPVVGVQRFINMFRYAAEPIGNVLFPLALVGAISLWRAGYRRLVGYLVWPLALNALAWLLGCYPMDPSRVEVYAIPSMLLLICAGIAPTWTWLATKVRWAPLALAMLLLAPVGLTALSLVRPWTRRDSATPVAFVLQQRKADEPVVGTRWEQEYYCRNLGPQFRFLIQTPAMPPTPISAAVLDAEGEPTGQRVASLWLLSDHQPKDQASHLTMLQPTGAWRIVDSYAFRDVTVLHVVRQ